MKQYNFFDELIVDNFAGGGGASTGIEDAPVARGGIYEQKPAVIDGNLITGRGAGCAVDFGLAILEHLKG